MESSAVRYQFKYTPSTGDWLMSDVEKVRENRLRRKARRQGFELRKSRRRDPAASDYGRWMIVDPRGNTVVAGNQVTGTPSMTLDEVEDWLWVGEDR